MKRIIKTALALLFALMLAVTAHADFEDYKDDVYNSVPQPESEEITRGLESIGIDPAAPESVKNLNPDGILGYIAALVKSSVSKPLRLILIAGVFAAICKLVTTLSNKAGLYGEFFLLACFIAISPGIVSAFDSAITAMRGCHGFMISYIPVFGAVVAASGNIAAATSYNAVVLYFCEAAAALSSRVLKPLLACMLVLSVTQAMNPDLLNITSSLKNAMTRIIGFIMTLFLGIIGMKTIVGRGVEGLCVRAGKYAVSSFIPVIGYSLSESYKAVSLSLSAIRASIGTFGIVVMCLYMLTPIITLWVYKTACGLGAWLCRLIGTERLASLMQGISDVFGFAQTVFIMFMLMMTVSTGMLVILGGELTS